MAIYIFACPKCGCECEVSIPMSCVEGVRLPCRTCGESPMARVYSPPATIIRYSAADYANRAAAGEEQVPGMSPELSRQTANEMAAAQKRR